MRHRWCCFHDDDAGYDCFEWAIPDSHPRFSFNTVEIELATFRFHGGQEYPGIFDGAAQFDVCLGEEWFSFWTSVAKPTAQERARLAEALTRLGLALPVEATAKWSGKVELYHGIRHYDERSNKVEV